jgi:hypothetical protein
VFLAIKHVKTMIRNKIKNKFLAYFIMIYIEREPAKNIDLDSIIDEFYFIKYRKVQLR